MMGAHTLAVQYLEDGPGVAVIPPAAARSRLRAAFEHLPLDLILLGWNLSPAIVNACGEEAERWNARLYRWQPLLTGDGNLVPRPEWQAVGMDGSRVAGFRGMSEFTFICPNRPVVQEMVLRHLSDVICSGNYHGVFLDRIRFPSPAADPASLLACFCEDCQRAAAAEGLDLQAVAHAIHALLKTVVGKRDFVKCLLDTQAAADPLLADFLRFRTRSITRFVNAAADLVHSHGLEVGLDCFSPSLSCMVGQDLSTLDACCEWVKVMSYGHVLGPAGIPFELLGLAGWLVAQSAVGEQVALQMLSALTHMSLPRSRALLRRGGISPQALAAEIHLGRGMGVSRLLAGIELVEMSGVVRVNHAQIRADLSAFLAAGADGLVLSWDLWHIPIERLDLVREVWV